MRLGSRHDRCSLVQTPEFGAEPGQLLALHVAARDECIEFLAGVELDHPHGVLDDGTRGLADVQSAGSAHDRHGLQVEIRRESAIEPQFFVAVASSSRWRRVVEEGELHRLLDLVGVRPGEQHPGDVRLDEPHRHVDLV